MSARSTAWLPTEPDVPARDRVVESCALRYEDVSQEGELLLLSATYLMAGAVWGKLLPNHPFMRGAPPNHGVLPVLSRLMIEVGGGPISVALPVEVDARIQLAHTASEDGSRVERIYLNVWVRLFGQLGRTNAPRPANAGQRIQVGQLFVEQTLTRPFAAAGARKVVALDIEGLPRVPPTRWLMTDPRDVMTPPDDARVLDPSLQPDANEVRFGCDHTDSNHHVNSLVYPRLFIDAALRRFAAHGRETKRQAHRVDIAFRKPCFAGDQATIALAAMEQTATDGSSELGAYGAFTSKAAPLERPYCALQMWF